MRRQLQGHLIIVLGLVLALGSICEAQQELRRLIRSQQRTGRSTSSRGSRVLTPSQQGLSPLDTAQQEPAEFQVKEELPSGVTIEGEILRPGVYLLQTGMRIKHLMFQAGGLIKDPQDVQGQLMRISEDGDLQVFFFSQVEALKGERSANFLMQLDDRVV